MLPPQTHKSPVSVHSSAMEEDVCVLINSKSNLVSVMVSGCGLVRCTVRVVRMQMQESCPVVCGTDRKRAVGFC